MHGLTSQCMHFGLSSYIYTHTYICIEVATIWVRSVYDAVCSINLTQTFILVEHIPRMAACHIDGCR